MYIIQNALQNLLRNKGRNLMIGAIIFVIIVSSVTALMIGNTADGVIAEYKTRFASEAVITPNMERIMEEAQKNSTDDRVNTSMGRPDIPADQYSHST